MADPIHHPATGEPIELGPDERLCRIAWPGAPVLVIVATQPTYRAPAGELAYRLARPRCRGWNPAEGLPLEPWPAAA
jgi:hypothetical protein